MTPIACQVPGTAWQKTCRRACGSETKLGSAVKTTPEVPSTTESGPGSTTPTPSAPAAWSPAPAATGTPAPARRVPGDLRRLQRRRKPAGGHLERVQELFAPVPGGHVEEQGPGGVGHVGGVLAREPQTHVVLGQADARDPAVRARASCARSQSSLGAVNPVRARLPVSSIKPLEPEPALDLRALGSGALVVPEDGGAERPVLRIQTDQAVHLARETYGQRLALQARERALRRAPPHLGVLLRPAGLGGLKLVLLLGLARHLTVGR